MKTLQTLFSVLSFCIMQISIAATIESATTPYEKGGYCNLPTNFCITGPKDWALNTRILHSNETASLFNAKSPIVAVYTSTDLEKKRIGIIFVSMVRTNVVAMPMQLLEKTRGDIMQKSPETQLITPAHEITRGKQTWAVAEFIYKNPESKSLRALYITKLASSNVDITVDAFMTAPLTENDTFFSDVKNIFTQMINSATFDKPYPQ